MPMKEKKPEKEKIAWILDYLPLGHPDDTRPAYQKKPLVQAIGEKRFVLMEAYPREDAQLMVAERVELDGEKIDHVKRRIGYKDLTNGAQKELPFVIEKIILENEERFINFFNDAYPITTRLHMLELLPGIGKKLMWAVIEERERGKFKSFQELVERVKGLHAPERLIAHRVEEELKDDNIKYRIFTTPLKHAKEHKETPIRHKRH
jgi:putative nucleotide binding protein